MKKLEKSVESGLAFHLCNGKVISNVKELYDEIQHMSEDVFSHHVTSNRNDFSNWVKDVFGEKKLSQDIAKAATPTMLKRVLSPVFADKKESVATKVVKAEAPKKEAKKVAPKAAAKTAAPKAAAKKAAPKAAAKTTASKAVAKPAAKKGK